MIFTCSSKLRARIFRRAYAYTLWLQKQHSQDPAACALKIIMCGKRRSAYVRKSGEVHVDTTSLEGTLQALLLPKTQSAGGLASVPKSRIKEPLWIEWPDANTKAEAVAPNKISSDRQLHAEASAAVVSFTGSSSSTPKKPTSLQASYRQVFQDKPPRLRLMLKQARELMATKLQQALDAEMLDEITLAESEDQNKSACTEENPVVQASGAFGILSGTRALCETCTCLKVASCH
jgi:hypothetical protein